MKSGGWFLPTGSLSHKFAQYSRQDDFLEKIQRKNIEKKYREKVEVPYIVFFE